jgi:1-acyl-sn-glycerol-3-phosphate acyltransferase
VRPQARRTARALGTWLFAVYVWTLVVVVGVPVWFLVAALPTLAFRWKAVRAGGRLLAASCGIAFRVSGAPPERGPFVVVANHASFIDSLALMLALSSPVAFVAGGELASQRIAGPFLRRLGCVFVDQDHPEQRSRDAARITDAIKGGRSVVFFAEGSLHRAPGLRTFQLGAFVAAAGAHAPLVPVGIRGSRDVVRPGGRFPRHGAVTVAFGDAIEPSGIGWTETLALRDQARAAIVKLSGEPDLE